MTIFDYNDYRKYLKDHIDQLPQQGRGFRKQMADQINCQMGFITQVFNEVCDFSLEQTERLSELLGHNDKEKEFFILLVEHNRAGTTTLKSFFKNILNQKKEQHYLLVNQSKIQNKLSDEDKNTYYSKWYYGAIHMIVTISDYQSVDQICHYLDLPIKTVREVLDFLVRIGLIEVKNHKYQITKNSLFLAKDSPQIMNHHTNWRVKAIESLQLEKENDLHFSQYFTISKKDAEDLKNLIAKHTGDYIKMIIPSPEEKLMALTLDLFEV